VDPAPTPAPAPDPDHQAKIERKILLPTVL
jgi:hypothetical protein